MADYQLFSTHTSYFKTRKQCNQVVFDTVDYTYGVSYSSYIKRCSSIIDLWSDVMDLIGFIDGVHCRMSKTEDSVAIFSLLKLKFPFSRTIESKIKIRTATFCALSQQDSFQNIVMPEICLVSKLSVFICDPHIRRVEFSLKPPQLVLVTHCHLLKLN